MADTKPNYPPVRRVVTGHDSSKTAKVLIDGPATNAKFPGPATVSTLMWVTDSTPCRHAHRREDRGHGRRASSAPRRRPTARGSAVIDFPPGNTAVHAPHRDHRLRDRDCGRDRDGHGRLDREAQGRATSWSSAARTTPGSTASQAPARIAVRADRRQAARHRQGRGAVGIGPRIAAGRKALPLARIRRLGYSRNHAVRPTAWQA